jgi:hypothetical protein
LRLATLTLRRGVEPISTQRGERMTWCRSVSRALALGLLAAAAGVGLCGPVAAAGLATTLGNGQTLSVIESTAPGRSGFAFERRYPDGTRDRQFGPRGRVDFEMGSPGGVPTAVRTDASGNILVVGSEPAVDGSRSAVVLRFVSTGQIDSRWGDQGRARLPVAHGNSLATDVLPTSDGNLMVVGSVEAKGTQQASIWRVGASGHADALFGQQGAMLAAAFPLAQVLSIQQAPDGALLLAVQMSQGGKSWIEVHRWRPGDAFPLRVSRQELPEQWVGPPTLALRAGKWFWVDPSQPESAVAVATMKEPDSPWTPLPRPPTSANSAAAGPGHAVMNPYSGKATTNAVSPQSEMAEPSTTATWLGMVAVALLAAVAMTWWSRRS